MTDVTEKETSKGCKDWDRYFCQIVWISVQFRDL